MTEAHWLSAHELGAAYRDRRLSPVEVVTGILARIGDLDPRLHVFTRLDREGALAQARAAEEDIGAGRARGPLHGVPVGIKDIVDVAGLPTTCHSAILLDNVAARDATVVRRLREAGAIILGKVATWEFAFGGPCFDLPFPPAENPWKAGYQPGGSSSGSGAGLAAGLFPLAIGSDTGGSVRHPAASCGIVGLKPTYGLVSRHGAFPLSFTMDNIGPMARSVRDVALVLEAVAGHDPADPGSVARSPHGFAADLDRGIRGLRIGFVRRFHEADMIADPEVAAGLEQAAGVLRGAGAEITEVNLPPLQDFTSCGRILLHSEAWSIHADWLRERPQDYARMTRRKLMAGAFLTAQNYVDAQRRRLELIAAVNDAFRDVDLLLAANSLDPAGPLAAPPGESPVQARQARLPFNLTGHPAIGMMTGLSGEGMPLSMQLVGRAFDERLLLRAAAAYERATRWHALRAPVAA